MRPINFQAFMLNIMILEIKIWASEPQNWCSLKINIYSIKFYFWNSIIYVLHRLATSEPPGNLVLWYFSRDSAEPLPHMLCANSGTNTNMYFLSKCLTCARKLTDAPTNVASLPIKRRALWISIAFLQHKCIWSKEIKMKSGVIQENYSSTEDSFELQLWVAMLCLSQLPTVLVINNQ